MPSAATTQLIQNPAWAGLDWLRHGATTRPYAESRGLRDKLAVSRQLAIDLLGDPDARAWGEQCHADAVAWVESGASLPAAFPSTDSVATKRAGVLLCSFTADCVPVVVVDEATRIIGVAHAGWRGSLAGIAGKLVASMIARGSRAGDLSAWIAPSISGAVYEVSPELVDQFASAYSDWAGAILSGRMLDLPLLNSLTLERAGLAPDRVAASPHCTLSDSELFYSYRRDNSCGAHLCTGIAVVG